MGEEEEEQQQRQDILFMHTEYGAADAPIENTHITQTRIECIDCIIYVYRRVSQSVSPVIRTQFDAKSLYYICIYLNIYIYL